jgi:outer membrane protein assembly factor BamB
VPQDVLGPILPLGVVPVFVNAGAALLPAILAGLASIGSLMLRPSVLWRSCRARPGTTVAIVGGVAGLCLCVGSWTAASGPAERRAKVRARPESSAEILPGSGRMDWAAMARLWIEEERRAAPSPGEGSHHGPAAVQQPGHAVILGNGPLRNGCAGGASPVGLTTAWEFPTPGSPVAEDLGPALFIGSPVVAGDAVYAGSCLYDVLGNYGTLFCLDAATGTPRWSTSVWRDADGEEHPFKGFFSTPAISADGKCLVVGQGLHFDEHCSLLCLSAITGRLHWQVPTPLHIEGSPAIDGDLAVAGAGAVETGSDHAVSGHPGLVLAVRVSTGEKLWEYQVNDPESSPVIDRGIVYIGSGFHGNAVLALRVDEDAELSRQGAERLVWRTATPYPATGAVTLTDDLVLIGCGNGDYVFTDPKPAGVVLALDRKTGQVQWQVPLPDGVLGRIAVHGDCAIVPVRNGEVVALDLSPAANARVLWRQRLSGERAILAGPAFTGTHVYAVSQDGYLGVLDARDGRVLERHLLNATGRPGDQGLSISSPTLVAGRVYVGSETGGLRCLTGRSKPPNASGTGTASTD